MKDIKYCLLYRNEDGKDVYSDKGPLPEIIEKMKRIYPSIIMQVTREEFDLQKHIKTLESELDMKQKYLESIRWPFEKVAEENQGTLN